MLALIPLDNRPCNVRFPQQIAAIAGDQLSTPPDEFLGRFNTAGQPEKIIDWLRHLEPVSALIVSCDMLAYGGLVASRRLDVAEATAVARLEAVRRYRAAHPETPIYAFSILMRLTVTMDSEEAVANYYNIQRFARLADEAERFNSEYLREQLDTVRSQIPPDLLEHYRQVRRRNHLVNRRMIDWLNEGVFDYLLITQEDATEFGLHRQEQDALLEHARRVDAMDKMSLHPGADEAALTLLARQWQMGTSFRVHWTNDEDASRIAPFEDRPYDQALQQHVAAIGGVLLEAGDTDDADFELFVNAPVGGSAKDEEQPQQEQRAVALEPFVSELIASIEAGRKVALCDVAFPNGADDVLLSRLEKRGVLSRLTAFGGWNTAGNTTGTLLAQCIALQRGGADALDAKASTLNRQFVFERLLDDWFYQSRLRARLESSAYKQGISPLNMGEQGVALEAQLRRELRGYAQLMAQRHFGATLEQCEITLPWMRTFEVDFRAELATVGLETEEDTEH